MILRKMLARRVPNEIANRAKHEFSAPDANCFNGESIGQRAS
jgi:hypothetical protein